MRVAKELAAYSGSWAGDELRIGAHSFEGFQAMVGGLVRIPPRVGRRWLADCYAFLRWLAGDELRIGAYSSEDWQAMASLSLGVAFFHQEAKRKAPLLVENREACWGCTDNAPWQRLFFQDIVRFPRRTPTGYWFIALPCCRRGRSTRSVRLSANERTRQRCSPSIECDAPAPK